MEFHSAHFDEGLNVPSSLYSVKASTRLVEVFQRTAESGRPYLFVEDEDGQPIGVLAAADILQKITRPNPFEMRRRMDMPADSALQGRIEMPSGEFFSDPEGSHDYTKVSLNGKLLGVITDTDVLISWKSIQQTVENSQGDAVTDLPNRASFDYHLEADCNRAERWQHSVSALLVDLDHFKQINDTFGHASGDSALHVVAQALRASLRSCDMVTRFVGDEFAVVCSGCRPGEIDIVLRRIRETVLALQTDPSTPRPIPIISVGATVAHNLQEISDPADLVSIADQAL